MRHAYLEKLTLAAVASPVVPSGLRRNLLGLLGIDARNALVAARVVFDGCNISIGDGTYIGIGCYLEAELDRITIGRNCGIGAGTKLLTRGHKRGPHERRAGEQDSAPVVIGDGCCIFAGVTVVPGVTIADGCIIAAGAVVTRDTEPDGLYAGVPAARVRELP